VQRYEEFHIRNKNSSGREWVAKNEEELEK
jgi:hypothetical protein